MTLAVLYAIGWLPLFVFRVEAATKALPFYEAGERLTVRLAPVIVAAHVTLACVRLSLDPLPPLRLAVAVLVYLGGLGLWCWGRHQIGPLLLRRLPQEPPQRFRRDGAFGLVRHPLYCSYVVLSGAPVVATGSLFLFATFAAASAVIALRAVQEERWLRAQVGAEYDEYSRQVSRLIPFVW